jgi:hypothetical protein
LNIEIPTTDDSLGSDILKGAPAIGRFINEPVPRVYYLAERQILPIGRLGSLLIASKRRLREHYEQLTGGEFEALKSRAPRQVLPPTSRQRVRRRKRNVKINTAAPGLEDAASSPAPPPTPPRRTRRAAEREAASNL